MKDLKEIFEKNSDEYNYIPAGIKTMVYSDFEQSIAEYEQSKWVSVEDRLPEVDANYLVTDGRACMVAAYQKDKKQWDFWGMNWWSEQDVIHWQELPTRPKP